jgi:uncharacterized protein YjbJ (UPF0337 family)
MLWSSCWAKTVLKNSKVWASFFAEYRNQNLPHLFGCEVAAMPCVCHMEIAMNWSQIEGNWKEIKGKAKHAWGRLTDDDLDKIAGKREELEGKIQKRYGITKDLAQKDVDEWLTKMQ